jgi:hypothetical protein
MYLDSLKLKTEGTELPATDANKLSLSLSVVPTMFGYTDIPESAVLQVVINIFSLSNFLFYSFKILKFVFINLKQQNTKKNSYTKHVFHFCYKTLSLLEVKDNAIRDDTPSLRTVYLLEGIHM